MAAMTKVVIPPKRRKVVLISAILGLCIYCYMIAFSSERSMTKKTTKLYGYYNQAPAVRERECSIYVAPSSLKGNPGYGIYTTRALWKGEKVLGGPDGVAIPVEGYDQLNVPKRELKQHWIRLWNPYWWGRGVPDHVMFEAGPDTVDFQIGFGYLPNHHCELSSLNPEYPEHTPYEDSLANRYESPGAGAFSYNIGREFSVNRHVKAGEELFMSYGYCRHGRGPGWTKDVHMTAEFEVASNILWNIIGPNAKDNFHYNEMDQVIWDDKVIGKDTPTVQTRLVKELLPETKQQAQALAAAPLTREDVPKYLARTRGVQSRTTAWIKEHGICLESLVPRKSTLPHAGQGGFAQFSVKKGDMITMAPLLHIMDRDVLALFELDNQAVTTKNKKAMGQSQQRRQPRQVGTQLLLNYCFSNPHSTILLCPTTNAVLINHCSNRTKNCGPNGPNADYRWSSGWDPSSDAWRRLSWEGLMSQQMRGLSFEFYALRDIAPGEEVFIDYGEAWERAWEQHVSSWHPPPRKQLKRGGRNTSRWITAKEANEQGGPILPEFILGRKAKVSDTLKHPYLMTGCVYWPRSRDRDPIFQKSPQGWSTNQTLLGLLKKYSDDGSWYEYETNKGYANHHDGMHWPCTVLWAQQGGDSYVVRIHPSPTMDPSSLPPWAKNQLPRLLVDYPRESIRYFVKPYASDQHLPGVFRQPIGLRDDILPEQWNNLDSV